MEFLLTWPQTEYEFNWNGWHLLRFIFQTFHCMYRPLKQKRIMPFKSNIQWNVGWTIDLSFICVQFMDSIFIFTIKIRFQHSTKLMDVVSTELCHYNDTRLLKWYRYQYCKTSRWMFIRAMYCRNKIYVRKLKPTELLS